MIKIHIEGGRVINVIAVDINIDHLGQIQGKHVIEAYILLRAHGFYCDESSEQVGEHNYKKHMILKKSN